MNNTLSDTPDTPDTSKQYVCYFCEEKIEFSVPLKGVPGIFFDEVGSCRAQWIHASTGEMRCHSVATPSNLELL